MGILDAVRAMYEIVSLADWATPLVKEAENVQHGYGNTWTFFIPNGKAIHSGWSKKHIEELLRDEKISSWGSWGAWGKL